MKFLKDKENSRLLIGCLMSIFLILFHSSGSFGSASTLTDEEHKAKLIEGAKKEGKLTWYTTTPQDATSKYINKFHEKYPFIEFDIYRSGDQNQLIKVMAELQAKRHRVDVLQTTGISFVMLMSKGALAKYPSPERVYYPEIFKDAEGYWTAAQLNLDTMGYNTQLVSLREVPKTWNDLLDPKWKGRMGMDTKAFWWFAHILKIMGEKEGLVYFEKLSKQDIKFRTGNTLNAQMVAAGEVSIGITIYNYVLEEMKSRGAHVAWVPFEPVIPEMISLAVSANAPHPNAARLFIDFMLSRDGQLILASTFRIPCRTDVDAIVPKLKKGIKILPADFNIAHDYAKYVKLYRDILMKR